MVLEGKKENSLESQDSQAILDALKAEFGVIMASSLSGPKSTGATTSNTTSQRGEAGIHSSLLQDANGRSRVVETGELRPTNVKKPSPPLGNAGTEILTQSHSKEFDSGDARETAVLPENEPEPLKKNDNDPSMPNTKAALHAKMDASQQTPTQVNDGRDYQDYCQAVPSSPSDNISQVTHNEPRTLQDDDTGAVNFGNLSEFARPSSQVSEDGGFENTKGEWRVPDHTSQQLSSHVFTPFKSNGMPPETPALPKNPFGAKPNVAVPFAGTQLFGQTQQLSSAIKVASPTSSRPSPNLFNSISPNIMETSPLKNRANVSSPTDIRTSSPQRLNEIPGTVIRRPNLQPIVEDTPLHNRSLKSDLIPESPTYQQPKSSVDRQPLSTYIPMKHSQERKGNEDAATRNLSHDSDSDGPISTMERKKLVEKKRARAAQEMGKVGFLRAPRRNSDEQPTRKKRRLQTGVDEKPHPRADLIDCKQAQTQQSSDVCAAEKAIIPSAETVTDKSTKATPREDAAQSEQSQQNDAQVTTVVGSGNSAEEDMIPATSPVRSPRNGRQEYVPPATEPELPTLKEDVAENVRNLDNGIDSSSLPVARRRTTRMRGTRGRPRHNPFISSSTSEAPLVERDGVNDEDDTIVQSPGSTNGSVGDDEQKTKAPQNTTDHNAGPIDRGTKTHPQNSPTGTTGLHRTRLRGKGIVPKTPMQQNIVEPTSSSLSNCLSTPPASTTTTPGTQQSISSDLPNGVSIPSPGHRRSLRRQAGTTTTTSNSPRSTARLTRTRHPLPQYAEPSSTDELQQSPFPSISGKDVASLKSSRANRQSFAASHRPSRLFEGMAFAISLQSDQLHENLQSREKLEDKIKQAGGLILKEGFQELFEHFDVMSSSGPITNEEPLTLLNSSMDCGFTALVADGHSRKAKYMQALALGLPCLAYQWISACLKKGDIVSWEPYLLCAGSSAVLGNIVRSRTLSTYDASDARLAEVISQRPRLLQGQRMLVVMDAKKARSQTKQQYIFLAQALGPSIARVGSVKEARETLDREYKAERPFSWLYIDESSGTAASVLWGADSTHRKKRRTWTSAWADSVRLLNDELVIQSLILGRMVEKDEMAS